MRAALREWGRATLPTGAAGPRRLGLVHPESEFCCRFAVFSAAGNKRETHGWVSGSWRRARGAGCLLGDSLQEQEGRGSAADTTRAARASEGWCRGAGRGVAGRGSAGSRLSKDSAQNDVLKGIGFAGKARAGDLQGKGKKWPISFCAAARSSTAAGGRGFAPML